VCGQSMKRSKPHESNAKQTLFHEHVSRDHFQNEAIMPIPRIHRFFVLPWRRRRMGKAVPVGLYEEIKQTMRENGCPVERVVKTAHHRGAWF